MVDKLLANLAPHHCCGCGVVGAVVCAVCKNNIAETPLLACIGCMSPLSISHLCKACKWPFTDAWCVGERRDVLRALLDGVKFGRKQAGIEDIVELLDLTLPMLPPDTVIVPVPASARSVREHGYDHMLLAARGLAKKRRLLARDLLIRQSQSRMHERARRSERDAFASTLFRVRAGTVPPCPILLIDDVVTTGATVRAAARLLSDHGAAMLLLGVVARHVNDERTI